MTDEQKLKAIARQLALDVPILRVTEKENYLTLYLYDGGRVEIQPPRGVDGSGSKGVQKNESAVCKELATKAEGVSQVKAARHRRQTHGHD